MNIETIPLLVILTFGFGFCGVRALGDGENEKRGRVLLRATST
jgi:hypothetical protein